MIRANNERVQQTYMRLKRWIMARLAGLEPATYGLEVRCSIQLSYRRITHNA